MPRISFCFSGWLSGAEIDTVERFNPDTKEIETIDVKDMDPDELADKLERGDVFVSLADSLNACGGDQEVQVFDFEAI